MSQSEVSSAAADDDVRTARKLVETAEKILNHLAQVPDLDLTDPLTFLALQLLGPVLARAVGDDPRRSIDNLIAITEQLNVDALRKFLKRI